MERSKRPAGMRAFAAIGLPSPLTSALGALQRDLQKNLGGQSIRWVRPKQVHLTLRFFGNVPLEQVQDLTAALTTACQGIAPFELELASVGAFPSVHKPSVIWIGLTGDLDRLHQIEKQVRRLTREFGDHAEDRAFHPHLTLGRVKTRVPGARRISELLQKFVTPRFDDWHVIEILLVQSRLSSDGSSYADLATIPLTYPEIV